MIIVNYASSPRGMRRRQSSSDRAMPDLQHWSDVTGLLWLRYGERLPNLRYVLWDDIVTPRTQLILNECVRRAGPLNASLLWPGVTFGLDSDQGRALLGTAQGRATARLLTDHMGLLGRKNVRSIVVFKMSTRYSILFEVADKS